MRFQFEMWRLFVCVLMFGLGCGLARMAWGIAAESGPISYDVGILALIAVCCFSAAIGVIFKRTWESVSWPFIALEWLRNLAIVLVLLGAIVAIIYGVFFRRA
jgi:hypothetical protein